MPRLPIPGQDAEQWGVLLNEFLRVAHQENGALSDPLVSYVETVDAMRAAPPPTQQTCALLLGYYVPGDGGGGPFYYDPTSTAADNGGTILKPSSFADGTPGRWTRLYADYLSVLWFGARPNHEASSLAAFYAAIEALGPVDSPLGGMIYAPKGVYRLDGELHINRQVILAGEGGFGNLGCSKLRFDAGCGLVVDAVVDLNAPWRRRGDWSVLQDLYIQGAATGPVKDGVLLQARASIERCFIVDFTGNGIHIAGVGDVANVNNWSLRNCRIEDNGGHGLYVHGADSNAGVAIALDCTANGGWGVYDSSFLGNTYIGCHAAANGAGPYYVEGGANFSVLVGCYDESDQPPSVLHQSSLVLGGDHGAGFADPSPQESAPGLRILHARNVNGFQVVNAGEPGVKLGVANQQGTVLLWQSADDTHEYRLRYQADRPGWWDVVWANSARYGAFSLSGGKAIEGAGHIKFPRGYFLGNGNTQRKVESGAAPPQTGAWQAGDRIYNVAPAVGGYVGWVCVAAGSPGVWKPFGLIVES